MNKLKVHSLAIPLFHQLFQKLEWVTIIVYMEYDSAI